MAEINSRASSFCDATTRTISSSIDAVAIRDPSEERVSESNDKNSQTLKERSLSANETNRNAAELLAKLDDLKKWRCRTLVVCPVKSAKKRRGSSSGDAPSERSATGTSTSKHLMECCAKMMCAFSGLPSPFTMSEAIVDLPFALSC